MADEEIRTRPAGAAGEPAAAPAMVDVGGAGVSPLAGTGLKQAGARLAGAAASRRAALRERSRANLRDAAGGVESAPRPPPDDVRWSGPVAFDVDGTAWVGTLAVTADALFLVHTSKARKNTDLWVLIGISILTFLQVPLALLWPASEPAATTPSVSLGVVPVPEGTGSVGGDVAFYAALAGIGFAIAALQWRRRKRTREQLLAELAEPLAPGLRLDDLLSVDPSGHRVDRSKIESVTGGRTLTVVSTLGDRFVITPRADAEALRRLLSERLAPTA